MNEKKTTMQTVQGRLCAALYERLGSAVLPVIEAVYGQYGYEVGIGLRRKWDPENLAEAMNAFIAMTNAAGFPSEVTMRGEMAHWTGRRCPFGLEDTRREVCEAMMAMDRALIRALLELPADRVELVIEQSLAAGDDCCRGTVRVKGSG